MKTPKEKAKEIYLKLYIPDYCYAKPGMAADWRKRASKRNALIAVDELEKQEAKLLGYNSERYSSEYWQEVKNEIQNV